MINKQPVVLIYKRTHTGDPNSDGIFGINNCMGRDRNWAYDAVIGIGGKSAKKTMDIAFKINWIGIYPTKYNSTCNGQSVLHVTFSKFCLYEEKGPFVKQIAPNLYKYMYDIDRRVVMSHSLPLDVYEDVLEILKLAEKCPPSKRLLTTDKEIKKCR